MNSKRTIMILILVLTIGIVGLTIAYFSNSSTVNNIFTTQPYGTTVTENFTSPSNWLPGQEVDKTVVATNTGNVAEAVRISLSESWTTANHGTLNGWITSTGTKSSHLPENEPSTDERVAIINFDNASDWEYSNGYYYYKYKLSPNESTSSLIKSVTFNEKTKLDDTCVETPTATGRTITCNSSGDDYDHATYTLTFNIETVQYNKYSEAWNTNVAIASEKPSSGVDTLLSTAKNADGAEYNATTKSKMFKMSHPATAQTPALTEYRYIGNDPYNYVYFNCDSLDNQNSETCEIWRIIGVFDVDDGQGNVQQRIKLVRGELLKNDYWNTSSNGNGYNDWTADNATLKLFLNGDYYNNTGEAQTNGYGLKASARNMIGDAVYHLGAFNWDSSLSTEQLYSRERENKACGSCNNDTSKTTWTGKVALMYPSDEYMVYKGVNDDCYNTPLNSSNCNSTNAANGWVYNSNKLSGGSPTSTWFLSPETSGIYTVFREDSAGHLHVYDVSEISYGVRPVLYLSSNVKITEGTGESTNPYKLGL